MYIIYISIFNYILPGNYCKRSRIYSPSDFAAVPDGNAEPAQNTIRKTAETLKEEAQNIIEKAKR